MLPLLPIPRLIESRDAGPAWGLQLTAWGIGLVVVVTLALLLGWLARDSQMPKLRIPRRVDRLTVGILSVALIALAMVVMRGAFRDNPQLIDEMAQLFQARVFASGRLAAAAPAHPEFFLFTHTWILDGVWTTQFPPGHAVVLALATLAGHVEAANAVLGGICLVLVFLLARAWYGRTVALLSAGLWLGSAWVLFMSATYMNHATATTLALAACAAVWLPKHPGWGHALCAGALLAATAATRPLDAVAAAIPVTLRMVESRRVSLWVVAVAGGIPVLAAWGYFNWRLYGTPWLLGYAAFQGGDVGLGFHVDPWGAPYTPLVALSNMVVALRRLHIALFEWPIPALVPLGLWAVAGRQRRLTDLALGLGVISGPVLYFFYWHSGFYPGPRFYYIAAPFLVIGTARAGLWMWHLARRISSPRLNARVALAAATITVVGWSAVSLVPQRVREYRAQFPALKRHPREALRAAGVNRAVVLVPESWGARVIVRLWAEGARPDVVERAYHRMDTCDLWLLGERARAGQWSASRVTASLDSMTRATLIPVPALASWLDPTTRLRPRDALPDACRQELARDTLGFTLYGPLAWRDPLTLDTGLVFARDWYEENPRLLSRYPGWQVWRYAPPPSDPVGLPMLERVR